MYKTTLPQVNHVTEIQVTYTQKVKAKDRPLIKSPYAAYQVLRATWDDGLINLVEQFRILMLNTRKRVIGSLLIGQGDSGSTPADAIQIFAGAIQCKARYIVLAHNHPSGSLTPSRQDIITTTSLEMGAAYLGLRIYDHIILTNDAYFSFRDNGHLIKK
ncbi:JAB domain-containing protein [Roseivirga sp. BDSF3-8]|uniref:JAB domain-containing protein n=1 Tax=Roseivirga sp. BDSF3-8 TaxID=3241598 RepID=UPI00353269F1